MATDFDRLLAQSEDELYEQLGRQLQRGTLGARERSPEESREYARSWFARRHTDLAAAICPTQVVRTYLASKRIQDRILLAAAIADLITAIFKGIPATTVAVLIVKEGLESLCGSYAAAAAPAT
jgi:hypothetical protein